MRGRGTFFLAVIKDKYDFIEFFVHVNSSIETQVIDTVHSSTISVDRSIDKVSTLNGTYVDILI